MLDSIIFVIDVKMVQATQIFIDDTWHGLLALVEFFEFGIAVRMPNERYPVSASRTIYDYKRPTSRRKMLIQHK